MARHLRSNRADGWYHVFHRGIERRNVFRDDRDRTHFLEVLEEMQERYRVTIHAYALMANHWHGVVQTPEANLSAAMQWLHLSHAAWFNARHQRVGPLWQGRFRAVPIEDGAWAYEVSLYVHLNPVCTEAWGLGKRAKRAKGQGLRAPSAEEASRRLQALRQYRWSSYRAYAGYIAVPAWLTDGALLARAHPDPARARAVYRRDLHQRLTHGAEPSKGERLRDAIAIGAEGFVREIQRLAGGGGRETSGKRDLRRRVGFGEIVRAVEQTLGEDGRAFLARRGGLGKGLTMWAARRYGGLTLRETGDAVGGLDYAAVSVALTRLERAAVASPELRTQMNTVANLLKVET
jgi:REP element-mobilizing transposase RayT